MAARVKLIQIYRKEVGTLESGASFSDGDHILWHETENNEKDQKIRETEFNRKGEAQENTTYTYDEEGRLTEKKVVYGDDESSEATQYTYDEKGRVLSEELYYDDEVIEREESEYDEEGHLVQRVRLGMEDDVMEANAFTYKDGKPIHQRHYDETDIMDWEIHFEYNDKGLCTKETHNKLADGITEYILYYYNENGKNTRTETRNENNELQGYVDVELDEEGRATKYTSETIHPTAQKLINQITHDEKGNIVTNEYFDVLRGNLAAREITVYNEDGTKHQEEVYELRGDTGKKHHSLLQYGYSYFPEENEKKNEERGGEENEE
jgi:hypothetical protein